VGKVGWLVLFSLVVVGAVVAGLYSSREPQVTFESFDDLDGKLPSELECVAAAQTEGLLDRRSPVYKQIIVRQGHQIVEEVANTSEGSVTASIGGCYNFGYQFVFTLPATKPTEERGYYLGEAIRRLELLPLRAENNDIVRDIINKIKSALSDSSALQECLFPIDEGYTSVFCSLDEEIPGKVVVRVGYDIAL